MMGLSNKLGWLILTTGNKSEMGVGYSTLYGDTAGGFAVIKDVFKTMVYDLCRWRNEQGDGEVIPVSVIDKPPSAELRPDQRDDQSLPSYEVLDAILTDFVEEDRTASELVAAGHDEAIVHRIVRLVDIAEYKRRQSPPGIRISLQGVRSRPSHADHQPLSRLTSSPTGLALTGNATQGDRRLLFGYAG